MKFSLSYVTKFSYQECRLLRKGGPLQTLQTSVKNNNTDLKPLSTMKTDHPGPVSTTVCRMSRVL